MEKLKDRMKARIEQELASVNRWIVALKREPRPEELETGGDNTPLSEEADAMQVSEEKEIRAELLGWLIERAASLDQALHRIGEGDYGICARCGRPIHRERLEALPEAAFCLRCQEQGERAKRLAAPRAKEWLEAKDLNKQKAEYE